MLFEAPTLHMENSSDERVTCNRGAELGNIVPGVFTRFSPNTRSRSRSSIASRSGSKHHEPSCGLAVVPPGGRRIEVHPGFDTSTFERLVGALERA